MILLKFKSTSFKLFTYFSMIFKSDIIAILLVMTMIPLILDQIKSTETSDLIPLKSLLILTICIFDCTITLSTLFVLIEMMTCFLKRPFVVILSLGLSFWLDLLMMLWISEILSTQSFGNTSLIFKKFWTLLLEA